MLSGVMFGSIYDLRNERVLNFKNFLRLTTFLIENTSFALSS